MTDYFDIFERNIGIFAKEEQLKLKDSTVLIAGIGGVGGPSALILARMGIGRLILSDPDVYSLSNLNRQMPSRLQDVGKPKTDIVAKHIRDIHAFTEVTTEDEGITKRNVDSLVKQSDVVITSMDGCITIVLQEALKRNKKMGLTASPMLNSVIATCFPPGGYYLSDIYPFDVDENDMQQSNRLYYAWVEVMTKNKNLFQPGYFPVVSAGTVTAAGLIGYHVTNYLARGDILFPPFPANMVFDTSTMKIKEKQRTARLFFGAFRLLPLAKKQFMRSIQSKVERHLQT
jgi:hypothetical protein